jgi:prepilin-type N-terminal cleavage/methylation domain-containing protein
MNRRGFTLMEVLIALGLIAVLAAMAVPRIGTALTRQSVRSARGAVVTMHAKARGAAIQRGRRANLIFNGNTVLVLTRHPVTGALETVGSAENLFSRYGVTVSTSRDTLRFDPRGLGMESGNTKITVQKGAFSEGIEISALGRVLR